MHYVVCKTNARAIGAIRAVEDEDPVIHVVVVVSQPAASGESVVAGKDRHGNRGALARRNVQNLACNVSSTKSISFEGPVARMKSPAKK
jgi:hypothetical protein